MLKQCYQLSGRYPCLLYVFTIRKQIFYSYLTPLPIAFHLSRNFPVLRDLNFHCRGTKAPTTKISSALLFLVYLSLFIISHFNIMLSFTPTSSMCSVSFNFSDYNCAWAFLFSWKRATYPTHRTHFDVITPVTFGDN
jgi:hypothetical protein